MITADATISADSYIYTTDGKDSPIMASDIIDPFCPNCLPAVIPESAEPRLQQKSPDWYRAMILVNLAFIAAQNREMMESISGVPQGGLRNVPAGTTNGTELPNRPSATSGARFEIPDGATVVIFFAPTGTSPGSPPAATKTIGPFDGGATVDEPTSATDCIFVTSTTGAQSLFRWVQR